MAALIFDRTAFNEIIATWPVESLRAAIGVIERYGLPHQFTHTMLIWHNNGPWKRTVVHRDGTPHHLPELHFDVIEQSVSYPVSPDTLVALAALDGSVTPDLKEGELSARCNSEEMNILALNIAHEIITGRITPEEGRLLYQEKALSVMAKQPSAYTTKMLFLPLLLHSPLPDEKAVEEVNMLIAPLHTSREADSENSRTLLGDSYPDSTRHPCQANPPPI